MIKAFLFDYDGVVTAGVPDGTLAGRLAKNLDVSVSTASEWIARIWTPLLEGKMSEDEVFTIFEEEYGKPISSAQRDVWFKWEDLTPIPVMVELLRTLKTKGYPIGVLSNATVTTKKEIRENGGYHEFDFVIISSEVGCKKPDAKIFEIALEKLPGLKPNEVVFLDDREPAVATASELGFRTILVKDHQAVIREVRELIS
jgi:epoxide hydrolase-like predicted phosphatase